MITMDKKYETGDGREVRIYDTCSGGDSPVHGAVRTHKLGDWKPRAWRANGVYLFSIDESGIYIEGSSDLIEVKPRIKATFHINVFKDAGGIVVIETHRRRVTADTCAGNRLARVMFEVDCEPGEGL